MQRNPRSKMTCSVARATEVVGERWTILVLREAFQGVTRFDVFEKNLGIAPNILAARLKKLVEAGVLETMPVQDGGRRREYRVTAMGRDFFPAYVALMQWGDRWLADEAGPPVVLQDRAVGAPVPRLSVLSEAGEALDHTKIRRVPGPGASDHLKRRIAAEHQMEQGR